MFYYFLPGAGIYGGIKVGYQWTELLNRLGCPGVVASPGGEAAVWFDSNVAVIPQDEALARLTPRDVVVFSLPHDHARLRGLDCAALVFHCQGTDPLIDPVLQDPRVTVLTCWPQARDYAEAFRPGAHADTGLSISDVFYYSGESKVFANVAVMPRRGAATIEAVKAALPRRRFVPIDGLTERETAAVMKRCGFFLATSPAEWFGLSALEAMAAGCIVLSVPLPCGPHYLRHGENGFIVAADRMAETLGGLLDAGETPALHAVRAAAVATAAGYRRAHQLHQLRRSLDHGSLGRIPGLVPSPP